MHKTVTYLADTVDKIHKGQTRIDKWAVEHGLLAYPNKSEVMTIGSRLAGIDF